MFNFQFELHFYFTVMSYAYYAVTWFSVIQFYVCCLIIVDTILVISFLLVKYFCIFLFWVAFHRLSHYVVTSFWSFNFTFFVKKFSTSVVMVILVPFLLFNCWFSSILTLECRSIRVLSDLRKNLEFIWLTFCWAPWPCSYLLSSNFTLLL